MNCLNSLDYFSSLNDGDFIIAVSQHAVEHTQNYLKQLQLEWKQGVNYIAVGQKSAQHLKKYISDPVHYPTHSDSEHLLALPVLQKATGKKSHYSSRKWRTRSDLSSSERSQCGRNIL